MGIAPADLLDCRTRLASVTGCSISNIGINPDASHLDSGGYHCGSLDLRSNGNTDDYSIRLQKDRDYYNFEIAHGGNYSSAVDMDDDWPRGGRAAWIRWNNMVVADLRADPNRIPGLRAINFSPEGSTKKRYDSANPSQGIISSTDTVLWHTHLEWYRWTVATAARRAGIDRLVALADAAVRNVPAPPVGGLSAASSSTIGGDNIMFVQVRGGDTNAGGIYCVMPGAAYHVTAVDWNNWPSANRPELLVNCPWSFVAGMVATNVNSDIDPAAFTLTQSTIDSLAHSVAEDVAAAVVADPRNPLTRDDLPELKAQVAESVVAKFTANLAA